VAESGKAQRAGKRGPRSRRRPLSAIVEDIERLFVNLAREERRQQRIRYSGERPKDKKAKEKLEPVRPPQGNTTLAIRSEIGLLVAEYVRPGRPRREVYNTRLYEKLEDALGGLYSAGSLRSFASYAKLPRGVIARHEADGLTWHEAIKATFGSSRRRKARGK